MLRRLPMNRLVKWCWKNIFWLMACAGGVGATPALVQYAYSARGYKAIGGEFFVPFLVPLIWYLVELVKGAFKEFSKELEEET